MSMLSVGNFDNKIISASVQVPIKREESVQKAVKQDEKISNKTVNILTGAAALASIAIACVAISRGRKGGNVETLSNNSVGVLKSSGKPASKFPVVKPYVVEIPQVEEDKTLKIVDKMFAYDEKDESLIQKAEDKVRNEISSLFKKYRDEEEDIPQFKYRPSEVVFVHPEPLTKDIRRLKKDDLKGVLSFIRNPQNNAKLSAGVEISESNDFNVMRKLINEALPLETETYVYSGIRTQKIWDDFKPLEFAENLKTGAIIKDKSFLVTSRGYDDYLAQIDPYNMGKDHKDSGYILRIILPEGTKGFDYRRCSGKDSPRGINALYVLPENSELEIRHIDDNSRIIDCRYLLPSK